MTNRDVKAALATTYCDAPVILRAYARGATPKQIARELGLGLGYIRSVVAAGART